MVCSELFGWTKNERGSRLQWMMSEKGVDPWDWYYSMSFDGYYYWSLWVGKVEYVLKTFHLFPLLSSDFTAIFQYLVHWTSLSKIIPKEEKSFFEENSYFSHFYSQRWLPFLSLYVCLYVLCNKRFFDDKYLPFYEKPFAFTSNDSLNIELQSTDIIAQGTQRPELLLLTIFSNPISNHEIR